MKTLLSLPLGFVLLASWPALGQSIRINEFMADNVTTSPDNVDFDDYSDWIELHNISDQVVSLDGYFLTDDPAQPFLWPIPAEASIPPNGYLVIRADGFDTAAGERHEREFSPWDNFTTALNHTNFKLSSTGETLGLFTTEGGSANATVLPLGSMWRFWDTGADPGADWADTDFDDTAWSIGPAQLGYGEGDEETIISYGGNNNAKYPAQYFRTTFSIDDPTSLATVNLRLLADDGAVVYLNGSEVARVRVSQGTVTYLDYASDDASEDVFDEFTVSPNALVEGQNTIAVSVHQGDGNSSDVSFDLELRTRRAAGQPIEVDSVTFGTQTPDVSYGRDPTDSEKWMFFGEPTAGAPNTSIAVTEPSPSSEIVFGIDGGFYQGTQSVSLSTANPDALIRYSLDGSWPTSRSSRYEAPITVTQTTVVRARTFEEGKVPGPLATQTYFINAPQHDVPIIAFTVDPEIFFDDPLGIYENVHKGREAPVNLAYYAPSGDLAFQVNAGTKIGGENIWRFAQKPLNVSLRGKYGDDTIGYQLFPDQRLGSFSKFGLRNGGDNWDDDMLRDAITPRIMRGQMENDVEDYQPTVLYMNGRYWGIHNLRSSLDPAYFAARHQVDPDNYDHLEYGHITSRAVTLGAKEGFMDDYLDLEAYATNNDLSDPAHFAHMESLMDMDSFIDFVCIEDFVNNTSWRHNREFWRERKEGAKWRWIVPDLDRGLNTSNQETSLLDNFEDDFDLFENLVANTAFRDRLAQRYAAHLSSTFSPNRIADIIDEADAEVRSEIARHIERWREEDGIQSLEDRQEQLDEIKEFARDRAPHVYADFRQNFDMPETVGLTVNVSPVEGGQVLMNGVPMLPGYDDTIELFQGLPSDAEAIPAPGYEFVGWSNDETSSRIAFTPQASQSWTATFRPIDETVLPPEIDSDLTLSANATYTALGTINVPAGVTLTISEGVTLRLARNADLRVSGNLQIAGSEESPVRMESRLPGQRWGSIAIVDGERVSRLSHVVLRGGSLGGDPTVERGAISIVGSEVEMDYLDIDDVLIPIFAWESKVTLRSSYIHTPFTGDGINVKHGEGLVEGCTFRGNDARDTDAIDFDDVANGIIRNNRIYAFRGPNSDGIDLGEGCVGLLVTGNRIYNNSDKGISVGQASTVRIERNLIVGCAQGVGIKDTGSTAWIDQNTFAQCDIGVAVFEKNLGAGGGISEITNSIFSRSKEAPVTVDSLSSLTVSYSLSDTLPLDGSNNILGDPDFADSSAYNFSLIDSSLARDAGDPSHPRDADGSRADLGAYYVYDPNDYPFHAPNSIVINEILSHSHDGAPDWIELHNGSKASVDLSGWFLSDDKSDLRKYQIGDGTIIPANGYLVFYENETFGEAATPFALSENGETVYLFAPGDGVFLDYLEAESFGPSPTGVSKGRYLKSTNTFNFVAMTEPTPGAPNSAPEAGPIVISEIMYHPNIDGDAEYLELLNIGDESVTLYDPLKETAWRFTDGITFDFPTETPVSLAAGERVLLVRDEAAFHARFPDAPATTQIFQWADSGLSNGGERIELSSPGDVDELGNRQWVRIDRVNYGDSDQWPIESDGGGLALVRIDELGYGNDVINWMAAEPTPGTVEGPEPTPTGYDAWAETHGLTDFDGDSDGDGILNGLEYALGLDPHAASPGPRFDLVATVDTLSIELTLQPLADISYALEISENLTDWQLVETTINDEAVSTAVSRSDAPTKFVRLAVSQN